MSIPHTPLHGLVAATHTPFHSNGDLHLEVVEKQAAHLEANCVPFVFIGGTTGECHSLSLDERIALAKRWMEVTRGSSIQVVVHVGGNCLTDACTLAQKAQELGAIAVAAFSPSYFKPNSVDTLVQCMGQIASSAPKLPFYFYDIPSMTGVQLSMTSFMEKASDAIPNLVGLKFTNSDLMMYQELLHHPRGPWDIPFGCDEALLAALSFGAKGAVGSTYNFAAPIYHRLHAAYQRGDLEAARLEQYRSVLLVRKLFSVSYVASAKEVMDMVGVPIGPPRLPCNPICDATKKQLRSDLESMGFLDWIQR